MKLKRSISSESSIPLSEKAYIYLKEAIIKGEFKPGKLIYEREIANILNISTSPVREALKKLSAEGFIEANPNKPASVTEASIEKFLGGAETMSVLDSYACKKIIKEISDEDIEKLNKLTIEMEECCRADQLEEFLDKNAQIHITIWKMLKNEFLYSTIMNAFEHLLQGHRHILYSQWTLHNSYIKKSVRIHNKLIKAFKDRNKSLISKVVKDHWEMFWK